MKSSLIYIICIIIFFYEIVHKLYRNWLIIIRTYVHNLNAKSLINCKKLC